MREARVTRNTCSTYRHFGTDEGGTRVDKPLIAVDAVFGVGSIVVGLGVAGGPGAAERAVPKQKKGP